MRDINDFSILVQPGVNGAGEDHWMTFWEKAFPRMRRVQQRDWEKPDYADWGPRNAEQVVMCVHGLTRNGRDFDFLARRLAARGVRVLAPDLPGRGRSGWIGNASDYATPLYLAATANDPMEDTGAVCAVIEKLANYRRKRR